MRAALQKRRLVRRENFMVFSLLLEKTYGVSLVSDAHEACQFRRRVNSI